MKDLDCGSDGNVKVYVAVIRDVDAAQTMVASPASQSNSDHFMRNIVKGESFLSSKPQWRREELFWKLIE